MASAHEGGRRDCGVRALAIAGSVVAMLFVSQPTLAADETSADAGAAQLDEPSEPEPPPTSDVSSQPPSSETPDSAAPESVVPAAPPSETSPAAVAAPPSIAPSRAALQPLQPPAVTVVPSDVFARSGAWLASVDDALPLFGLGAASSLSAWSTFRIGDPGGMNHLLPPRPVAIDVAIGDRLTAGFSPVLEQTVSSDGGIHIGGLAVRAGYVFSLGERVFLWPRAGLSYVDGVPDERTFEHRLDLVVDGRVGWTPRGTWALTVGPSLLLPVAVGKRNLNMGSAAWGPQPPDVDPLPRIALSAGLTVRLDDEPTSPRASASEGPPRFLLGIERAVPLLRVWSEYGADARIDVGTTDSTNRFPVMPRAAFDVVTQNKVTIGAAASAGYVRTSSYSFVPGNAPDAFVMGAAPRLGGFFRQSEHLAFWPRVGLTCVYASASRPDGLSSETFHIGADLDAFAVAIVARDVGITFGPSLALPLAGSRRGFPLPAESPYIGTGLVTADYSFLAFSISAGLVLLL